jgi:hypothetical protein
MSNIDWHAYLDDTLDSQQRAEADRVLALDPQARRRLENMKSFVAEIRRQGLTQEVPLSKLHRGIPSSKPRFSWPRVLMPSLAGVAAIAIGLTLFNRPGPNAPVQVETYAVQDYQLAAEWMRKGNGIETKPVRLAANLVAAERLPHAGCYCVKVDGKIVHLAFHADPQSVSNLELTKVDGREYMVGGDMVCFKACGLIWMTHGATEEIRWKIAKEAAAQLQT